MLAKNIVLAAEMQTLLMIINSSSSLIFLDGSSLPLIRLNNNESFL
ncbi:hypothetical protein ['Cynodon dactylon' phytoplasma]|nr:hypothetical protein ['Cynodon dactylon' phytoplasma]